MVSTYHLLRLKIGQLYQHLTTNGIATPHSSETLTVVSGNAKGYNDQRKSKTSSYWLTPIGFGGLQFIFFAFASQGVTHFNTLGLTRAEIAITLLSPPVCGGFFQPYFGSWSDQVRSPWGRRKPFIIIGTAVLIFSALCLGWTESIARFLTGTSGTSPSTTPRAVIVGLTMFWTFTMFTAIQAVQVGLRALITDGATPTEQAKANAWASGWTNLAAALLNLFAYMDWPLFRGVGNTVYMNMSVPAVVCLITTISVSCATSTEVPSGYLYSRRKTPRRSLRAIWRFFATTSKQIRTICLVQVFAWFGWFPFIFYTVTYVNGLHEQEVGEIAAEQVRSGQDSRMGALTLLLFSLVSLLMAMLLPTLVRQLQIWSMPTLWIISQALFGVSMLGSYAIRSSRGTVLLFGSTGFSWATSTWVPYALLGAETSRAQQQRITLSTHRTNLIGSSEDAGVGTTNMYGAGVEHDGEGSTVEDEQLEVDDDLSDKTGLIYGLHNLSICIPQILLSLGTGFVWMLSDKRSADRTDEQQSRDLVWILRLGGIAAFVAMYYACGLQEPFADYGVGNGRLSASDASSRLLQSDEDVGESNMNNNNNNNNIGTI